VRLPIPPPPQGRYFFGAGWAGADGLPCGCVGSCNVTGLPLTCIAPPLAGEAGGAGAGARFAGAVCAPAGAVSRTVFEPVDAPRVAKIESDSDVIMNTIAEPVVAFESSVAEPRGPKAVCDPMPPNAPAKSAAFPLCSNTTMIRKTQTIT